MSFSTNFSSEGIPSPTLSDMTAATTPPSPPDTVDFDAEHYWESVTFKSMIRSRDAYSESQSTAGVEDSDHFSTLFDLENKLGQEYGLDDPHLDAVKLEDVAVSDFQTFLNVLYPRDLGARPDLTQAQWMTILVLATRWRFRDVRKRSIKELKNFSSLSEKLRLAEELTVPSWCIEVYVELVQRGGPLLLAEAEQLGMVKTLALYSMRETRNSNRHCGFSSSTSSNEVHSKVNDCFFEEFEAMRKKEAKLYPTKDEKRATLKSKAKAEREVKALAEKETALQREEERKRIAGEYGRMCEEQREKLALLEQKKDRILSGAGTVGLEGFSAGAEVYLSQVPSVATFALANTLDSNA
ncbi:hypothetical protein FA13DRAFT_1785902 [Coprinellus micaceus]|uniref:BTB domain-containing protein n=1 Tax=Coprinellus micaceus TaxID=71717 RepID=A0A4Y7TV76_COPMI|nr:hypothetical protein FA13DRAFT_1785902 [Coprinellus micaceus]